MARPITIGNGNLLVGLDERGLVRDFYFPHVGHSNHVSGASGSYVHRVGVFVDGRLSWLSDPVWTISIAYTKTSGASDIWAHNTTIGISLHFTDVVHNEKNIFLRKVTVKNERSTPREIKLFFGQEFRISESRRGDTAFYDPRVRSIVHYKGHNAFLVHAQVDSVGFTDYSVGLFGIENREGSYTDAEDGILSQNPIEHGSVDSVVGLSFEARAKEEKTAHYWITVGTNIKEAHTLHEHILSLGAEEIIRSTEGYWRAWKKKDNRSFVALSKRLKELYQHSLVIMRLHSDNEGGIIASSDTDILNQGRDTYGYVWPRDAAYTVHAFDRAGHIDVSQRFFEFMAKQLEPDGYFMHKYRVDGVLGSSWHPWMQKGEARLPIQEDETAIVLFMLRKHYSYAQDLELIEKLYNTLIEPSANFLASYIENDTGLPIDSYDLWEEKYGSSTYTAAAVYGALQAAAEFSAMLGKRENAQVYRERAEAIKRGILTFLFDVDSQTFIKAVRHDTEGLQYDRTVDMSSIFGIVEFGVLPTHDVKVQNAFKNTIERLTVPTDIGGYVRYEGDGYYKTNANASPNPWCITTLWVARHLIKDAQKKGDLKAAKEILEWVGARATLSGILPEQVNPYTGAHLSTAPLVWSHAEFVTTVDEYLKKHKSLK